MCSRTSQNFSPNVKNITNIEHENTKNKKYVFFHIKKKKYVFVVVYAFRNLAKNKCSFFWHTRRDQTTALCSTASRCTAPRRAAL